MDLSQARGLAHALMAEHGLIDAQPTFFNLVRRKDWSFTFDHGRLRFGLCDYHGRRIQLSRHLTRLNDEAAVRETLRHEIAHALTCIRYGKNVGHDARWKAVARSIGANPLRCYDGSVVTPAARYLAQCANGHSFPRSRRFRRGVASCAKCSPKFNSRYLLRLVPNPQY